MTAHEEYDVIDDGHDEDEFASQLFCYVVEVDDNEEYESH